MRAAFLIAALAASVIAQTPDLSQLPKCATSCVGTGLTTTGCSNINVNCICASKDWINTLSCCVSKACSEDDQKKTIQFAHDICAPAGVALPSAAGCSSADAGPTSSPSGAGSNATVATTTPKVSSAASGTAAAATKNAAAVEGVGLGVAAAVGLLAVVL
ncbi:hypothetical protein EJ06DRAFT_30323 [Trichodelitschia bisporula]|uniref:CFEM domain-containing protein n=1 Tax=Trichodelitschia bisporula TaxID=703511 RepID=A0A6G1IB78_9PEZI|nr:hypothetical protein EJ06DRAFT_30323 [Trichodelitschia bisporula]